MRREDITPDMERRLWNKINKTDNPKECWEWQGSLSDKGYGKLYMVLPGRGECLRLATRVVWTLQYGTIGPNLCVCHECDNRKCVNINHLWLGTKSHNAKDMWRKGRNDSTKSGWPPHARGKWTESRKRAASERWTPELRRRQADIVRKWSTEYHAKIKALRAAQQT